MIVKKNLKLNANKGTQYLYLTAGICGPIQIMLKKERKKL